MNTSRTGAQILVDALAAQHVNTVFGVPGESYLSVLDALHGSAIRFITCRQEGGAAMMAEATGKLTNRPGICFVTRGPGATNAAAGVHIAQQDSTPMIVFIGQVARGFREREAFQEVDYRAFFGNMAKWVVEIDDASRIPELVARAFRIACQGRPGPVVVALPEDMLADQATVADVGFVEPVHAYAGERDLAALANRLAAAERPLAIVGGSGWDQHSVDAFTRAAEGLGLPVATSFRRQALFSSSSPCHAGHLGIAPNPKLVQRIRNADLLLLVGGRLSEMPSQSYSLLGIPLPSAPLVHVHADAHELGRVYQPALAIQASPHAFAPQFEALARRIDRSWADDAQAANHDERLWSAVAPDHPGTVQMGAIITFLRDTLPDDAILCNGAGNYAGWLHRFYRFRRWGTQLAPTSGSMGYGLPAALAAKSLHPDRPVVAFAGDGCFLMHGQEFATAIHHQLPVIIVVVDNGMYGTIRMHQEKTYPGRVSGTGLTNPDFAALARAYGGFGDTIRDTASFAPAWQRATASGLPAILHVLLDPEAITPALTLSALKSGAN
jgi:acetolactate synthase I/II/III large subunit